MPPMVSTNIGVRYVTICNLRGRWGRILWNQQATWKKKQGLYCGGGRGREMAKEETSSLRRNKIPENPIFSRALILLCYRFLFLLVSVSKNDNAGPVTSML